MNDHDIATSSASALARQQMEDLRLHLLRNGYVPLPNVGKACYMPGWPKIEVTPDEIKTWTRRQRRFKDTGIRIEDGLCAIDIDIDHPIINEIADAILDICPQLEKDDAPLLVRKGKGLKEAWFVATPELFSRLHSRRWVAPGSDADAGTHSIEIFGGASPRQFGAFGAHSRTEDGVVLVNYQWVDHSPADTPKSELPLVTKAECFLIVDMVEKKLASAGFTVVERSTKGENDAVRQYDLVEEMSFDLDDGRTLSLLELREVAKVEEGLRCSASWLEGATAANTSRCIIGTTRHGHLTIWESASGVTHMEVSRKPRDYTLEMDRIAEKLRELAERERYQLDTRDDAATTATKLRGTYAFCARSKNQVVPIWATTLDDGTPISNFRLDMAKYGETEIGPRGGEHRINPVDIWINDERRLSVAGLRMRPDKERPLYEEDGAKWVNVYAPPLHDAPGGSHAVGEAYIEHLLPDETERRWFLQWLAHKYRFPYIPGPAVIMVARNSGTGRGTLGELVSRLFGRQYVRTLPFAMVAGSTYQSQYTDWGATALLAVVNESLDVGANGSTSTYKVRSNTYEHLKELVEPRPIVKQFVSKRDHFAALSFTTYLIFSNNTDALPIAENDRRFAVLTNGEAGSQDFWVKVNAWMDDPANVAAFARWLESIDLEDYSPFVAPASTAGKQDMILNAMSDFDLAFDEVVRGMPTPVMTLPQIEAAMRRVQVENDYLFPERWNQTLLRKHTGRHMHRVGVKDSTNWQLYDGPRKVAVYAPSSRVATEWKTSDRLREEVLKNGSLSGGGNVVPLIKKS